MILDATLIQDRINKLIKQRDDFVTEANRNIARIEGAIGAYEALLRELEEVADGDSAS
jgi:hypothetical protein